MTKTSILYFESSVSPVQHHFLEVKHAFAESASVMKNIMTSKEEIFFYKDRRRKMTPSPVFFLR